MLRGMQVAHFGTKGHHWRINLGLAMNADMFVINKEEECTTDAVHMGTIGSGVWSSCAASMRLSKSLLLFKLVHNSYMCKRTCSVVNYNT